MKIYNIGNKNQHKARWRDMAVGLSDLKKAAGGEDQIHITREAMESFRKNNVVKLKEQECKNLALRHINDYDPEIEKLDRDPEFRRAEKLALMAELVARVVPLEAGDAVHEKIAEFVMEQLTEGPGNNK